MNAIYKFDPPADISVKDISDLIAFLQPHIDKKMYAQAPANIQRLFKPSVMNPSPSRMYN